MQFDSLVRRPRRVSLAAIAIALFTVVLGGATALAAFAPLPGVL
ncbi:hypothetical protein WBO78_02265 [Bosea sp. CCNWLW174]|jgi:hypothetical protein|uniref:Uncharacterized protein n=1 Tax=Bosea lupini TaxID=1036779 RepID=A0A1H7GS73_9HYPH|nr:hypothetical protein [Bosea lupini]SEK41033.1 hypothetical protein SAMN04515666_101449 [Bosea lupini]